MKKLLTYFAVAALFTLGTANVSYAQADADTTTEMAEDSAAMAEKAAMEKKAAEEKAAQEAEAAKAEHKQFARLT